MRFVFNQKYEIFYNFYVFFWNLSDQFLITKQARRLTICLLFLRYFFMPMWDGNRKSEI